MRNSRSAVFVKLKMQHKPFGSQAPSGPAGGAYTALPDPLPRLIMCDPREWGRKRKRKVKDKTGKRGKK